ncbi:MAG: DNA-processing protein DprA [Candidatus Brocadiia bacterium]|jgi:DNA processing protein
MSQTAEISYWALLHALPGMGPVTFRRLLDRFGSAAEAVEKADRGALAEVRGMRRELADALLASRSRLDSAERTVAALQKKGVHLLRMTDPAYPPALHDLPDPPPLLYVLGQIGAKDRRAVSMVGTTKPSARGRPIAEEFGKRFAAAGVTVVSGYAHGIDAASHRGAFKGGGRSILCVPYGIRHFKSRADFPALAEIAQRGAVVSECPPDLEWSAAAAVARDRIIAALGRAVFVIETRPRGGTMHTVRAAEQLGRPLFVLKYRAPPESARGNSILIARGATDVGRFGEIGKILDGLGPDPRRGESE